LLELTLESTRELVPMILALGESAEVLEPASLRREVAVILRGAVARYGRVAESGKAVRSRSRSVRGVG
jgi:predicted DNA-binding transcriptional regulator YafY